MKKAELIFVPSPGVGHLASAVEAAKLLLHRDDRISITVFVFKRASDSKFTSYSYDLTATPRLRLFNLPMVEPATHNLNYMQLQMPQVRKATSDLFSTSDPPIAGFVLDMFCLSLMDVASEFGVPSFIYFTSNAAFLGFLFHLQLIHGEQKIDLVQAKESDADLVVPTFMTPLPARVLPTAVLEKEWLTQLLELTKRYSEAKGILVNSFTELESHALDSLSRGNNIPPVYPVGPILNLRSDSDESNGKKKEIMDWLDDQPLSSVVFLCFGSEGAFSEEQVKEIASALEHSNHRFLWSLRRPPPPNNTEYPTEFENLEEVLPVGFKDRTAGIGKIIGWAPQTAILGHPAVGGFVSHCGWNSILESLWFGVPIATWPLYAEQQFNAFEMVKELELAAEIKMDYRKDCGMLVKAEKIERGIRCVMEHDSQTRKSVIEMSQKSKMAVMDGGSSFSALNHFIQLACNILP